MASEDITPRSLIQGLIETSSVSKSVATGSRARGRRSLSGRPSAGSRVAALRDGVGERPRSVSDLTPRSLIQGVLQNTDAAQPPDSKRARLDTPPKVSRPRGRPPGTLSKSSGRRRPRAGRLEALATPGNDPTPRSLIQGLTQAAPVETPAVHLRRSSTLGPAEFPDVEDALQGRVVSDTPSPLALEPGVSGDQASQRRPSNRLPRRRQPLSSAEFAAGVREKLSQGPGGEGSGEAEEEEEGGSGDKVERAQGEEEETEEEEEQEAEDAAEDPSQASIPAAGPEPLLQDSGDAEREEEEEARLSGDEVAAAAEEAAPRGEEAGGDRSTQEEVAGGDVSISRDEAGEEASPDSRAPTEAAGVDATPLADRSLAGAASKQAADSTWTGQDPAASAALALAEPSPTTRRVADSTVRDSSSENSAASASEQPAESETSLAAADGEGDGDGHQTTMAESQSRLSGYSPLVTPRLPPGQGRPTPALKRTPAHLRPSTAERDKAAGAGAKKAPPKRKPPQGPKKSAPCLSTSLTRSILAHFSKARVSKEAVEAVEKGAEVFFKRLGNDLAVYSHHGHRQTIEQADVELLMTRQGLIKDQQSMYALIEKYLPLEYRQELIPMAMAGNKVTPKPSQ